MAKAAKQHEEALEARAAAQKAADEAEKKLEDAKAALAKATCEREQLGETPEEEQKDEGPSTAAKAEEEQWTLAEKMFMDAAGDDEEAKNAWVKVQSKRREKAAAAAATAAAAEETARPADENRQTNMDVETLDINEDNAQAIGAGLAKLGVHLSGEQAQRLDQAAKKARVA